MALIIVFPFHNYFHEKLWTRRRINYSQINIEQSSVLAMTVTPSRCVCSSYAQKFIIRLMTSTQSAMHQASVPAGAARWRRKQMRILPVYCYIERIKSTYLVTFAMKFHSISIEGILKWRREPLHSCLMGTAVDLKMMKSAALRQFVFYVRFYAIDRNCKRSNGFWVPSFRYCVWCFLRFPASGFLFAFVTSASIPFEFIEFPYDLVHACSIWFYYLVHDLNHGCLQIGTNVTVSCVSVENACMLQNRCLPATQEAMAKFDK